MQKKGLSIALLGNPNCGKTTLFNALTGAKQRVGNWPGVTVEQKVGEYHHAGHKVKVVDLPGTYSLDGSGIGVSEDERIARQYAMTGDADLIVNIVDAANLQRHLYLTCQLLDLGRPMLVVLNMMDALVERNEELDIPAIQAILGCPVVGITASKNKGIPELLDAIAKYAEKPLAPSPRATCTGEIERWLECRRTKRPELSRFEHLSLLENGEVPDDELPHLQGEDADIAIASARYDAIDKWCHDVVLKKGTASATLTEKLDRVALSRVWGVPVFLFAMYLMFLLAINLGSVFIDFFDGLTGTLLVDGTAHLLTQMSAPDWLIAILAHGVGGGIQTVSTFIPVVAAMFLCLSFLEDSGYLARAAMVIDRAMRAIGLPGKAFVPMLVGFGCNVPAIMGTRTLDSNRDRLTAIMMMPFMSCGARLPVYALFAAVFFAHSGQNVVFALYLLGIAMAILTGFVLKHTLLPGEATPFVMELPPYRLPTVRGILTHSWMRLKSFIVKAGKAIVTVVVILSVLNSLGTDGTFGNENTDKSVLASIGRNLTPVFEPMGIQKDNWPATVGVFTGIFAKEAVVGTLDSLYTEMARHSNGEPEEEEVYDPVAGIQEAFATIPANLADLTGAFTDPLGIEVDTDKAAIAEDQGVHMTTFGQMNVLFGSAAAAFAYLVFILLYTPCVAALGAVYREAGGKWMMVVACWTFALAWVSGTLTYQIGEWAAHPLSSLMWVLGLVALMVASFFILRKIGARSVEMNVVSRKKASCGGGCSCS